MTSTERFRRLKDKTGLTFEQLSEIFGVDILTSQLWYSGKHEMQIDSQRTLLRIEGDNIVQLSPKLRPSTVKAFNEGRRRTI